MDKMTKYGIISDIHCNFEPLCNSIKLLKKMKVDSILHLGDVVDMVFGYGDPDPVARLMSDEGIVGIRGNHDEHDIPKILETVSVQAREYLSRLPKKLLLKKNNLVYGTLIHSPLPDYEYLENIEMAQPAFQAQNGCRLLLAGHTHIPVAFSDKGEEINLTQGGKIRLLPDRKYILNPGSIGMPRDISLSSFGILDTSEQTFEVVRF